jgi:hypothetical protein
MVSSLFSVIPDAQLRIADAFQSAKAGWDAGPE